MLEHQKDKFSLPNDVTYLNTSYMSPLLKSVESVGIEALQSKSSPFNISPNDFFEPVETLKKTYAELIDTPEYNRIVCIPSVSYGIACVTNNVRLQPGDEIIVIEDQFPSNYYSWKKCADSQGALIKTIAKPKDGEQKAKRWNEAILNAISSKTKVVAMCQVHWADGSLFDLMAIRKKTNIYNALLIIDGTQSVGAFPFSVDKIQPDALICASYKWLLGPYAFGLGYFGPFFDEGSPIEESWGNRVDSEDFSGLTNYTDHYKDAANRYGMGESANFISVPMATKAINQIIAWTPEAIQHYCHTISKEALAELQDLGFTIEDDAYRGHHLIGIKIPDFVDIDRLKTELSNHKIHLSFRGQYMRVSPHLYNVKDDFTKLVQCIISILD